MQITSPTTPEETLADEGRWRVHAAAAGFAAGVLWLGGSALTLSTEIPPVHLMRALREHLTLGAPPKVGLKAQEVLYVNDHALQRLAVALVLALAAVATGILLTFLYRSAYARRQAIGRATVIVVIAGTVLSAIPTLVAAITGVIEANSFAGASNQSAEAARAAYDSSIVLAANSLAFLGHMLLGLGILLVSLKAMSVGLLTRFMGVLGAIGGVLFILPLTPLPLVQVFWFIAAGALYLGKSGSGQGMPQAWTTGESVPWPSQQEIREAKLAARAERQGGGGSRPSGRGGGAATKEKAAPASTNGKGRGRPSLPETPAPQAPKGVPHSSSKKKKRKRR